MTGGGAENWCTFHMHTAPTASATTATNGIQTRAKTVLPTERGLTRSPPRRGPETSCFRCGDAHASADSRRSCAQWTVIVQRLSSLRPERDREDVGAYPPVGWLRQIALGTFRTIFCTRIFSFALLRIWMVKFVAANIGNTPRNVRSEGVAPCKW